MSLNISPDWAAQAVGVALALTVLGSCIWRANLLTSAYKLSYGLLYTLMGVWAGARLLEAVLLTRGGLDWIDCIGLLTGVLHMWITRDLWDVAPPARALKRSEGIV